LNFIEFQATAKYDFDDDELLCLHLISTQTFWSVELYNRCMYKYILYIYKYIYVCMSVCLSACLPACMVYGRLCACMVCKQNGIPHLIINRPLFPGSYFGGLLRSCAIASWFLVRLLLGRGSRVARYCRCILWKW
jgi:hypothetical protein